MSVTHVTLLLDKSGSMAPKTRDVIGGYNDYIQGLKDDSDIEYRVTVNLFDTLWYSLHKDKPVAEIPPLDEHTYRAGGNTALNDATGRTLTTMPDFPTDDRILVVITTDGEENSSHEYKIADVKELISERQNRGWGFLFLGAGPEAWASADAYGIPVGSTQSVVGTAAGIQGIWTSLGGTTRAYARTPGGQGQVTNSSQAQDWSQAADPNAPRPDQPKPEEKKDKLPKGEPI